MEIWSICHEIKTPVACLHRWAIGEKAYVYVVTRREALENREGGDERFKRST